MTKINLNYPRRHKRTISNMVFEIAMPSDTVSWKMKNIRSSNTKIELIFEEELKKTSLNYTKPKLLIEEIDGNPDFVIPRHKIAIFCDGDFWHGYNLNQTKISTNSKFWQAKINRNIERDLEVNNKLKEKGWTVFRFWEHQIKENVSECVHDIKNFILSTQSSDNPAFTFVDLFAGIGGFRIPLEELGGKCLGFSEIDKHAIEVYKTNFSGFNNDSELELGNITNLTKLPFDGIDLIVGGVPCQSWSVAGKMRAFDDPRGKLWENTIEIVRLNQPKAFVFENVKGLIDPRNKENLNVILSAFDKAGYVVKQPQLLNSYDFGLPQNRDRIFIVGIRKDLSEYLETFEYPGATGKQTFLYDLITYSIEKEVIKKQFDPKEIFGDKIPMSRNRFQKINELNDFFIFCDTRNGHTTIHSWDIIQTTEREKGICMMIMKNRRKKKYGPGDGNPLSFPVLKSLIPDLKKSELKALIAKKILREVERVGYEFVNSKNSSGINGIYRVYLPHSNIFSTLTATGTKDYIALQSIQGNSLKDYRKKFISEIVKKKRMRPISAKEAGLLQGFPKWFSIHPNEALAKKQFGNAVSTSVIYHLACQLIKSNIFKHGRR